MISAVDQDTVPPISAFHPDIIQTHILTRLDGPTLASAACTSSHILSLSSNDTLWRQICTHTWPSTADPRVRHVIGSFASGYRSFYSDSFPALYPNPSASPPSPASELISAVDIHFKNKQVISRVKYIETKTDWFMSSPFRVDLLDPKEMVPTRIQVLTDDDMCHLSLNWILIDPTRARAGNFSSLKPVSVTRHWLTGDLHVRFATILLARDGDPVHVAAVVMCSGEGKEVQVKEVSLVVEDMEGRNLNGEDSLVILQDAMENGERRRRRDGEERERWRVFAEMKRESRERKQRKETRMDVVCVFSVVTVLVTWALCMVKIAS